MAPPKRLVLALGNPLAGDDAFGPAVLARLRRDPAVGRAAELDDAHTDLLGHIERLAAYDEVVLVDAALEPARAGEVVIVGEETFAAWPATAPSAHQVSPLVAVQLFRRLHPEARTRITLVALCVPALAFASGTLAAAATEAGAAAVRSLLGLDPQPPTPDRRPAG